MEKIWIIYHSKHGNCKKLADEIGSGLKGKYDVHIGDVVDLKPEAIVQENPDALLVGARIIIGKPDRKVRKFVSSLGSLLEKPIPKAACFYTHGAAWSSKANTLVQQLKDDKAADELCTEVLSVRIQKMKGPAATGQDEKIRKFIDNISAFVEA